MENSLVPREPLCKPTWRVLADTHSASRRSRSGLAHGGLRGAPLKRGPRVCSECGDGAFCTRLPKATRRLNPASPQITEGGSSSSQEMVRDSVEPASGPALDAPLGEAEGERPRPEAGGKAVPAPTRRAGALGPRDCAARRGRPRLRLLDPKEGCRHPFSSGPSPVVPETHPEALSSHMGGTAWASSQGTWMSPRIWSHEPTRSCRGKSAHGQCQPAAPGTRLTGRRCTC